MTDRIDLDTYAKSVILDVVYGMDNLNMDELREKAYEGSHESAENSCTYTRNALDIIERYSSHPAAVNAEDLSGGETWKAQDWRDAMTAEAYNIARAVIQSEVSDMLDEIEDSAAELETAASAYGCDDIPAPRISADCPHGWAPHEKEDADGVLYWAPRELEGCKAVAIKVGGVWLSHTWTPKAE